MNDCGIPGESIKNPGAQPAMSHTSPLPVWLKKQLPKPGQTSRVQRLLKETRLSTVCEEAKCPNRGECYSHGMVTFLIMGDICTRGCLFCSVKHGRPCAPDPGEPGNIGAAIAFLHLSHVVITCVTRDDLPDYGAQHIVQTILHIRKTAPCTSIELLCSDLCGDGSALRTVLDAKPDIFGHNIETVPRIFSAIRPGGDYSRSLHLLRDAFESGGKPVKSGFMVGLGETGDEVHLLLQDLFDAGVRIVTIGQYLRPGPAQVPVHAFITPEQFSRYDALAHKIGFKKVFSGPFVRSSYRSHELIL